MGEAHGCTGWWEVFDSEIFNEIADRIAAQFGEEVWESPEYIEWTSEMAGDL